MFFSHLNILEEREYGRMSARLAQKSMRPRTRISAKGSSPYATADSLGNLDKTLLVSGSPVSREGVELEDL